MKAYVFPGQGAQFVGMGKDLYDNNPLAKETLSRFARLIRFTRLRTISPSVSHVTNNYY